MDKITKTRLTKAQKQFNERVAYDRAVDRGVELGRTQAKKEFEDNIRISERKSNIELVRALASMTEATARAIITTIGEGGLHG